MWTPHHNTGPHLQKQHLTSLMTYYYTATTITHNHHCFSSPPLSSTDHWSQFLQQTQILGVFGKPFNSKAPKMSFDQSIKTHASSQKLNFDVLEFIWTVFQTHQKSTIPIFSILSVWNPGSTIDLMLSVLLFSTAICQQKPWWAGSDSPYWKGWSWSSYLVVAQQQKGPQKPHWWHSRSQWSHSRTQACDSAHPFGLSAPSSQPQQPNTAEWWCWQMWVSGDSRSWAEPPVQQDHPSASVSSFEIALPIHGSISFSSSSSDP